MDIPHVFVIHCVFHRLSDNTKTYDTLRWRHNERDGVPNHQPHDCLLNCLFRRRSKKTWKLCVTGLCAGNSPGTGEFTAHMASNAGNVSILWRHHEISPWFWVHRNMSFLKVIPRVTGHEMWQQLNSNTDMYVFLFVNLTFEISVCTRIHSQHSFSNRQGMFMRKCRRFWDGNLRIHAECSSIWATRATYFVSDILEHCLLGYRYFCLQSYRSKCHLCIWNNIDFQLKSDVLQKVLRHPGVLEPQSSESCRMLCHLITLRNNFDIYLHAWYEPIWVYDPYHLHITNQPFNGI